MELPDVRLIRPIQLVIYDNYKKKIYFIFNCFKDQKINNYKKKYDYIKNEILNLEKLIYLKPINSSKKLLPKKVKIKSNTKKQRFLKMVNMAKKYIKKGDIFQVVLSQRFETSLSKSPLEIYKKLRTTNPSPFMYFFNFKDFQIIGDSPEILVRLRNGKITIRTIAGTRPRGVNKKQDDFYIKDLLKDKKELSEHLML